MQICFSLIEDVLGRNARFAKSPVIAEADQSQPVSLGPSENASIAVKEQSPDYI